MFMCDLNVYICAVFFLSIVLTGIVVHISLSETVSLLLICLLCVRCMEAQ